jgi:hypothetical protein
MGRWLSPDWSAKVEPVPYAKLDDPQTLNLYAYLMNSPLGGVDADGHQRGNSESSTKDQTKAPNQDKPDAHPKLSSDDMKPIMKQADKLVEECAGTLSKGLGEYGLTFSAKDFEAQMHRFSNYHQYPVPFTGPDRDSGSPEANTHSRGPMSGRYVNLYADFFMDTKDRKPAVIAHETLHGYTGWSDANIFAVFQHMGMTKDEVNNFIHPPHPTDGITTWFMRGCKAPTK